LEDAGFEVVGCFRSGADALRWLEGDTPEVVLLNVMLKDDPCVPLARALKDRGVPLAIYSGLPPVKDSPPELQGVPCSRSLPTARIWRTHSARPQT
jgi:hypothetical protein